MTWHTRMPLSKFLGMRVTVEEIAEALDGMSFYGGLTAGDKNWVSVTWPEAAANDLFAAIRQIRKTKTAESTEREAQKKLVAERIELEVQETAAKMGAKWSQEMHG